MTFSSAVSDAEYVVSITSSSNGGTRYATCHAFALNPSATWSAPTNSAFSFRCLAEAEDVEVWVKRGGIWVYGEQSKNNSINKTTA